MNEARNKKQMKKKMSLISVKKKNHKLINNYYQKYVFNKVIWY